MTNFLSSATNELKQTPIASTASAVAAIVSAVSLLLASNSSVNAIAASSSLPLQGEINSNNVLLIIAFYFSTIFFSGFLLKILAQKHDIVALVLSVPAVSLINFMTILVVYKTPPRELSKELFVSAHDLVFYSSACIFLAFFALPVLRDLIGTSENSKSDEAPPVLIIGIIILFVWGGFVSGGQNKLSRTFLPEIAQLPEKPKVAP